MEKIDSPKQQASSLKEILIYSALGVAAVGGSIFFANRFIQKKRSNFQDKKGLEPGSTADYAKQIKMAFDNDGWWGTNEESLRRVLRAIPDKKTFRQVAESYKANYNSPLTKDMQDELTSTEYEEMMLIVESKPEVYKKGDVVVYNHDAWAKRLYAAMSVYYWIFPGTDEDAIKAVFLEIPTRKDYLKVYNAYQKIYGSNLIEDLKGELSSYYLKELFQIYNSKPVS